METTNGRAVVQKIALPQDGRTICVSDIHGSLDVFRSLLEKINYSEKDTLLLLGDLYTKGKQGRETLRYIMELAERENVYALRGNCDWIEGWTDENERAWLKGLPHILESDDYIFVHSGIEPGALAEQSAMACMKTDAFLEKCGTFERYVVTGHWPTGNYTRGAMCCNPIIDFDKRVIAIDGGMVVRRTEGQLNAFIIERGGFSFEAADELPVVTVEKDQAASENPFTITWNDRFVEETDGGAKPDAHSNADEFGGASEFGLYRHLATGKLIELARDRVWRDENGRLCANGTNYRLPVKAGERVSVVREYSDRFMAKKDGIIGWVYR
ncbi:MAG: metallophosphoesterase [Oscillospiraceae bacterium]|nr:metallophosphoesterase [Oscillospiraceae bacterium]